MIQETTVKILPSKGSVVTKKICVMNKTFAFMLAGILSIGSNYQFLPSTIAHPVNSNQEEISVSDFVKKNDKNKEKKQKNQDKKKYQENRNNRNDDNDDDDDRYEDKIQDKSAKKVIKSVRKELARFLGISQKKIKVISYTQQTWPDGCLGIAKPGEFCTQVITEGWKVVVNDGVKNWVYRTNNNGKVLRLETNQHHDHQGGNSTQIRITKISSDQLPPPVDRDVIFRAIYSGGFAGRTYEINLRNDGVFTKTMLIGNGNSSRPETWQISRTELRQFMMLLQQSRIEQYNRLSYTPKSSAADYITVTLTSQQTNIRYVDFIASELPSSLKQVITYWNRIIK
jgi:hypothetical protein